MKKLLSVLLCAALVLGLFSGCHKAATLEEFKAPLEFDTSRNYEITFWAKNDTNMTQVGIYQQAIEDFQALYPNIRVNLRLYINYGDIYNDVITNIATNTTPNVCVTYPDHIATYLEGSNTVVPLDDLFADEKYGLGGSALLFDGPSREELIPQFLEECTLGNEHYAIPYMRSTEACYVNKTYVEALGYTLPETLTWDFVWEVSEAAMAKDAQGNFLVNGKSTLIPFIYKSTDNMMIQLLEQAQGGYSTHNGEILIFNDTTRQLLHTVAQHARTRSFSTFSISGYPGNFLNAGQCIFAVDSTAGATWMGSDSPLQDIPQDQVVDFETVVMPIPQLDTENPKMISQGPSLCIFNKEDDQEVLASWLFAQYMLTNKVQIAYSQTEGYVPVTKKAQQSPEYLEYLSRSGEDNELYYSVKIDAAKLLMNNVENTFVTPVFNGSTALRNTAGYLIESVTKNERRKKPVDDAFISALYQEATALYRLDQIVPATQQAQTGSPRFSGPLPLGSQLLLWGLGVCWVAIGGYAFLQWYKKKRKRPL